MTGSDQGSADGVIPESGLPEPITSDESTSAPSADQGADPIAEQMKLQTDEGEQRAGSGDAAPDQPWT